MLAGMRVLIVEDEPLISLDFEMAVRDAGGVVAAIAASVTEALQSARTDAIDIAILDIHLPDGETFDVGRELRKRDIPFVFSTGNDQGSLPEDLADVPSLVKPCNTDDVVELLARMKA